MNDRLVELISESGLVENPTPGDIVVVLSGILENNLGEFGVLLNIEIDEAFVRGLGREDVGLYAVRSAVRSIRSRAGSQFKSCSLREAIKSATLSQRGKKDKVQVRYDTSGLGDPMCSAHKVSKGGLFYADQASLGSYINDRLKEVERVVRYDFNFTPNGAGRD